MALKIEIEGRQVTLEQVAAAMAGLHSTRRFDDLKDDYLDEIMEKARLLIVDVIAVADYDHDEQAAMEDVN